MKIYESSGIIFRTIKYSETSIICDVYTKEKGLRSFIVSGVRSAKSGSKAAIYRHLNIVDLISYDQEAEKLARIKEISLHHHFQKINTDVVISSMAIFILEVCRNAIKEKEANPDLYTFLEDWLLYLDSTQPISPLVHILFMTELSILLGFGPMDNHSGETPYFDMMEGIFCEYHDNSDYILDGEDSQNLYQICQTDRFTVGKIHILKPERDRLTDNLLKYYKIHIPGFRDLNSLDVLRSVL
ncbi:MAG: DNA repair protein RecO [Saprospiraceae bacterium]|nr:DNA repair protein RecO [Saprospiraceae bacterium]